MAKPTIYKTIDIGSISYRTVTQLTDAESAKAKAILDKFFEYFAAKHY